MFKYIGQASQERGVAPYSFQPKWGVEAGEEDMVRLLPHRAPEEEYKSIHPPFEEREEPEYVVREMMEPITPRQRAEIEPGILAGRTIARTGRRGRTVHGQRGILFEPHSYLSEEAKRRGAFHVARTIIGGGSPSEETERSQVVIYRGAKGAVVDADPYFSAAMRARRSVEEPYQEKAKENLLGGIMHRLISKFKQTGEIEPDEMLELLKSKKYAVEKKKEDWLEEIEKVEKEEDYRHLNNILDLKSKFGRTGNLKPEEMLSLLESKKYAQEIKEEDWWIELEEIKEVEKEYYKGIPPFSKELENLLQGEKITVENARKSLAEFSLLVNEDKSREEHIKLHLMSLEKRLVTTLR